MIALISNFSGEVPFAFGNERIRIEPVPNNYGLIQKDIQ